MDSEPVMAEEELPNDACTDKDKKSKKSKKSKKRKHLSSDSESTTSPKRLKSKKHKKKCKKKHKHSKDKKHKLEGTIQVTKPEAEGDTIVGPEIPKEILEKSQTMAPLSKEEWEKKQNTIKRVFDKTTGRSRLIRGDGEIIEEIVSKERHQAINRQATQGDGDFFQTKIKKYV
ncbi:ADP-ribosylation factor-like protein 6-interacting protein 4 [Macrosteles quadrilineatus]|uniref:ADP-ribosylation factor-like protein 6-interacting protein 4 n=1 Tax=Macrosteles quadrilineatus TaxID=74068 RepID=UPI0023E09F7D|nr:ADP-ribosylation factor-like protein 6-interacting protein 4 [Macrosteles quadrilineatus]